MKQLFLLLAFVSMSLTAFAQQKVSGKVTDSAGEPIIGASIVVKANNTIGTISDYDGNFTLEVPSRSVCGWPKNIECNHDGGQQDFG